MTRDVSDNPALLAELRRICGRDETLRWHCRPLARRTGMETLGFLGIAWFTSLFLLITEPPADLMQPGFGLSELLVLAALGAGFWISVRQIQTWRNLYRTIYGITDRRVLMILAGWNGETQSVPLTTVRRVSLRRLLGGGMMIRITIGVSGKTDDEFGPKLEQIELLGLSDGERAFRLLTEQT